MRYIDFRKIEMPVEGIVRDILSSPHAGRGLSLIECAIAAREIIDTAIDCDGVLVLTEAQWQMLCAPLTSRDHGKAPAAMALLIPMMRAVLEASEKDPR